MTLTRTIVRNAPEKLTLEKRVAEGLTFERQPVGYRQGEKIRFR